MCAFSPWRRGLGPPAAARAEAWPAKGAAYISLRLRERRAAVRPGQAHSAGHVPLCPHPRLDAGLVCWRRSESPRAARPAAPSRPLCPPGAGPRLGGLRRLRVRDAGRSVLRAAAAGSLQPEPRLGGSRGQTPTSAPPLCVPAALGGWLSGELDESPRPWGDSVGCSGMQGDLRHRASPAHTSPTPRLSQTHPYCHALSDTPSHAHTERYPHDANAHTVTHKLT